MDIAAIERRPRPWLSLIILTSALVLALVAPAQPSSADGHILEPGDVESSPTLRHIANVPAQGDDVNLFHSDLAFHGDLAIQGSYGGLNIYDISDPSDPQLVAEFTCLGAQGDPSVSPDGTLVFMSVDSSRSDDGCQSESQSATIKESWEGIRVIDISDLDDIKQIATVETDCGSHTHTMVPGDDDTLYLYVSSYRPNEAFPDCQEPHDKISIVEVPLDDPTAAAVVNDPVLFEDGGAVGTSGCHDITVFPEMDLAAGACMGEGALIDISDPLEPYVITSVTDPNFAFWHSATFTDSADAIIFTDELGGGGGATCIDSIPDEFGANAYFDIVGEGDDRELVFRSYYKIPREQSDTENCVAHNGTLIPTKWGVFMVQAWYQGGVSIIDYSNPDAPYEVGYFDRGPLVPAAIGGSWSAYWYNGRIYSSDITMGLDVLRLTRRGVSASGRGVPFLNVQQDYFNAQTQYQLMD